MVFQQLLNILFFETTNEKTRINIIKIIKNLSIDDKSLSDILQS